VGVEGFGGYGDEGVAEGGCVDVVPEEEVGWVAAEGQRDLVEAVLDDLGEGEVGWVVDDDGVEEIEVVEARDVIAGEEHLERQEFAEGFVSGERGGLGEGWVEAADRGQGEIKDARDEEVSCAREAEGEFGARETNALQVC
jgi:hypothetical protein